jgi:5-methylcytosine-specific restriction endonuclease McrA
MEKSRKKLLRAQFRGSVFARDKYKCRCCGKLGYDRQSEPVINLIPLDAHHITDRSQIPNGGYVKENGISVCDDCHLKAEAFWSTGEAIEGFAPEDLYKLIGSSLEEAIIASEAI